LQTIDIYQTQTTCVRHLVKGIIQRLCLISRLIMDIMRLTRWIPLTH